jgi:hypothetical protein
MSPDPKSAAAIPPTNATGTHHSHRSSLAAMRNPNAPSARKAAATETPEKRSCERVS